MIVKKVIFTLALLFAFSYSSSLFSQSENTNRLELLLTNSTTDSIRFKTAIDVAWNYMYNNPDSALLYANTGLDIALKSGIKLNIVNAFNTIGVCYIVIGNYYQALSNLNRALENGNPLLKAEPDNIKYKRRVLAVYANIGNIYYYQSKYAKAIDNYIKSLNLAQEINYENGISVCTSNIGAAYKDLLNYPKALEYNYKALAIANKIDNRYTQSQCLNNLGTVYFSIPNYDSANYYYLKCIKINEAENFEHDLIDNYVNMGDVLRQLNKYDSALYYYNKAINISTKLNSVDGLINCNYMIAQLYLKTNHLQKSKEYFTKSLKLAEESGTQRFVMLSHEKLADVYKKLGNYKLAYQEFYLSSKTRDSIFNAESDERIADMETKYQTREKEKQISFLNQKTNFLNEKALVSRIVFISITIILLLIITIIIIMYQSYKNKQLAEKTKIQQQVERKMIEVVIETEDKERKRFAEDLHDGLGVLLSTLKLYINEIDGTKDRSEREKIIKQSNEMLDDAIKNARNIANNIMPVALKNNGLEMAINSFCNKINASSGIDINIRSINFNKHYKSTIEISIYRILTEMINNTLKHAQASRIDITLTDKQGHLFITYKDDGVGFDYTKTITSSKKGMGLNNSLSRMETIGAKYEIKTAPGKGFFAGIEVDVF